MGPQIELHEFIISGEGGNDEYLNTYLQPYIDLGPECTYWNLDRLEYQIQISKKTLKS